MSYEPRVLSQKRRMLTASAILLTVSMLPKLCAQESVISILSRAPLSLPRLTTEAGALGKKPVSGNAYEVLRLTPHDHSREKMAGGPSFLEIDPSTEWRQKLRNRRPDANYVSFTLSASLGSKIDIGGAILRIDQSEKDPAYASITANGDERIMNHETPWLLFGGARMAMLEIVTVKLDQKSKTWDLWFRDSLVAKDLPLETSRGNESFLLTTGKAGAWLCGLVCSDENPLFEDSNDNSVPDDFETEKLGKLLPANTSHQSVAALTDAWLLKKRTLPPSVFVLTTTPPSSFPDSCDANGAVVHGMNAGKKFGIGTRN
jgi:hypothetical protein